MKRARYYRNYTRREFGPLCHRRRYRRWRYHRKGSRDDRTKQNGARRKKVSNTEVAWFNADSGVVICTNDSVDGFIIGDDVDRGDYCVKVGRIMHITLGNVCACLGDAIHICKVSVVASLSERGHVTRMLMCAIALMCGDG
jgi:hypothetical protein